MRFLAFAIAACWVVACSRNATGEAPAMAAPDPVRVEPPRDAGGAADAGQDAGEVPHAACDPSRWARPLRDLPCLSETFTRRPVGFSGEARASRGGGEGRTLVSCISTCDPCPLSCTFDDGKHQTVLSYFDSTGMAGLQNLSDDRIEKLRAAHDKKLDDRLARLDLSVPRDLPLARGDRAPLRGPFGYDDLTFALEPIPDPGDGSVGVAFGARIDGEAPVLSQRIVLPPHPMRGQAPKDAQSAEARAEWNAQWTMTPPDLFVDVSRDGKELGLIAMSSGAMWYEASTTRRLSTAAFAAHVYAETARAARRRGATERAAELFAKAAAAHPSEWTFGYERAEALATLHDPRAEQALDEAVRRGGPSAVARARSAPAFATEAWFAKWRSKP